jgi:glycosyltransferase involved in cell wall biosynthesis
LPKGGKLRLLFIDGSTKLDTIFDLETKARGGMVASLFQVTDYLSSVGHDVTVLSDIREDGVTKARTKWLHEAYGRYDALICNRGVGDGYPQIDAKARILWTHDLPHAGFIPDPASIRAFACTVFMSGYAERVWRGFYRDIGRSTIISNGVDREVFYPRPKQNDFLIYASAPNRGLERLPFIFDAITQAVPGDLCCEAYSNLAAMHPGEGPDTFDYGAVSTSKVRLADPLPQGAYAAELGKASLMILPSAYPEICSNNILQALASGVPVLTTGGLGSAPEWINHGKNGLLTRFQPHDYMVYTMDIVRQAVQYLTNDVLRERLRRGAAATKIPSWQQIGHKWERMLSLYC